ncbi:paired box protein Pax-2 isoform X8 [Mustela putorius furo]|uniref:Paired box protein Pax-2 isoform X8 n=1 Tax=Mustela putorius furo TaxID=9669 RepID=A0A8U0RIK8_MUSPF|nr:paired box protein Pax-2 isoform X8 [Mustela putorius furo]
MDMHCKADPFSAMHHWRDTVVIFLHFSLRDALKTKRGSKEKSKSGRDGVEEPARRPLGRAKLCLQFWKLFAGLPLHDKDGPASDLASG